MNEKLEMSLYTGNDRNGKSDQKWEMTKKLDFSF